MSAPHTMRWIRAGAVALFTVTLSFAAEPITAVHGTISRLDEKAKMIAIKTADGTEHTVHFVGKTAVHGTTAAAKDTFHGLKQGSEVVAYYSAKGADKTAVEVDRVAKDGVKSVNGTVSEIDRGGKKLAVKSADGSEQTFRLADQAAMDAGKGVEKSSKVTVYYTEEAGRKIAHFFER